MFVDYRWLVVTPTSELLRETVDEEEQQTSNPDPDPYHPEVEALFPVE